MLSIVCACFTRRNVWPSSRELCRERYAIQEPAPVAQYRMGYTFQDESYSGRLRQGKRVVYYPLSSAVPCH